MQRSAVIWLAVAITFAAWALAAFGAIPFWIAFLVTLGVAFVGALNLDRTSRGARAVALRDQNRAEFSAPMGNETWQVPTSYIDHRTGAGPPPGVERYDEEAVKRQIGDHGEPLDEGRR